MKRRPPRSPLFPYTTLFRSHDVRIEGQAGCAAYRLWCGARQRQRDTCVREPERLARAPPDLDWDQTLARLEPRRRSEEHTSELQSRQYLVCRLLLEKKKSIN